MAKPVCPRCAGALTAQELLETGVCGRCGARVATVTAALPFDAPAPPALVAFDVETTGLYADSAGITEIAAVKFEPGGAVVDTFVSLANPGYPVKPNITRITGITDAMVSGARPAAEVLRDWVAWLGPDPLLVAHNAPFDLQFVAAALDATDRAGAEFRVVDTLPWAQELALPVENHRLETLLAHVGHSPGRLHRAEADARGVVALCLWLAAQGGHVEPGACRACLDKRARSSRLLCALRPAYRRRPSAQQG